MAAASLSASPIPLATVAAAPAAAPAQVAMAHAATLQRAPIATIAPPSPTTPRPAGAAGPTQPLQVPTEFRDQLAAAVAEGHADAATFAREHRPHERWMVVDWAMLQMAWPPKDDAKELAYLHQVAAERTDAGIARARFWSSHGMTDEWERLLEDYVAHATPAQARRARKLLHDTLMMMNSITQAAKAGAARDRPFAVDPTLPLAVDRPGNNPSYPSGHTSAAYAACTVLAHLMPDRREEFMDMAREASWARVYSGVHFPSDVLAGAKLATTVAGYLARVSGVAQLRGTGASVNTGVTGARRAPLPGAARLSGTPIAAAHQQPAAVMAPGQPA